VITGFSENERSVLTASELPEFLNGRERHLNKALRAVSVA
jgi:hypothetical protein